MLDVVELGVQHHGVCQIRADGLENGLGAGVVLLHQCLNDLQLLRGRQIFVQRNAGGGRQLDDCVLGEILAAHAEIRGPLVLHGVLAQVNGGEGQLVDPAENILVLVHVAHGLGGTHGDAHDIAHT